MTNEERDLITRFIQRVGGGPTGGAPPLPPIDREADALIADLFARTPEARYRITQTAFVQEHALAEAQNRIQRLEWELQQARQQAQAVPAASPWGQPPQPQPESRGFFGGLFGGARQAPPPPPYAPTAYAPPPPQYAPGYQPGMFQQRGSGFLGSALTTAAGVAGGVLAANALSGLFSGSHGGGFGSEASSTSSEFIPIPPSPPDSSPWATPTSPVADPYDAGGADKGGTDNSGWTSADRGGWDSQSSADSGGWSDSGGGGDDWS